MNKPNDNIKTCRRRAKENMNQARNRARKYGCGITTDKTEEDTMRQMYRVVCYGNKFALERAYAVDHIVPLSRGGTHELSNIQIMTFDDNCKKSVHLHEKGLNGGDQSITSGINK